MSAFGQRWPAAGRDFELLQADVAGAYLNGTFQKEVYTNNPEGLAAENAYDCVGLENALYCFKQSVRQQ